MQDFKVIIKNKNFLYLWSSQILSQLSINVMNFLLLIKLFSETGSTIATSLLWVAWAVPAIVIGPFAAASVDIVERRKILIISNILQALTILFYVFVHQIRFFIIYGVVLIYSFLNQFYVPAESASLPSLVKEKDLPHANGLFLLTQQAALIVGFGIAGILNTVLGFKTSIFLCSFALFLAFISVLFLPRLEVEQIKSKNYEESFFKFFRRIVEGYTFIKDNKNILMPFILLMILQICLAIITVNFPAVASEIFRININSAGLVLAVPAGIGAAISALTIPKLMKTKYRKKEIIEKSILLIIFAAILLIFLVPILEGFIRTIVGILVIMAFGFAFIGILIPAQTYLQEKTPGGLRGRVFGNFWFLTTIATLVPVVFSGTIVELFGIKLLLFLFSMVFLGILIFSKKLGQKYLENGFYLNNENV